MQKRDLGQGGARISPIGIGAMSFTNFYGPTTEPDSHAILDLAQELGVSHIDTSNVYGMGTSEKVIGNYLAANPAARDHFNIATKAGIASDSNGKRYYNNTADYFESELDGSLKKLGVDCVDLFYAHRRNADMPIEEIAGNLARLVEKGKTRAIGFSEIAPSSLRRAVAEHPVAAVQSEYSLSTRAPELGLVQTCAELGTALVAFSPVGRSLLTDNPLSAEAIADLPFLSGNPRFMEPNYSANLKIIAAFRALASDMGVSTAALSMAWVLHQGDHVIPIPGTRSVDHFRELAAGMEIVLTADDLTAIEQVLPVGWAHGDRYNDGQWVGPERFC